ncbi:sortilin-related receptor-like [Brachionus plicatilis]|uniref:Sortilin-related receptor-like n=1 Tax=Brachionus plicatilis TaxID=10195 RepID=A0A3M7SED4_BRAPC|nr:sortilin-related receptor-like [Brachionus plicatilis]
MNFLIFLSVVLQFKSIFSNLIDLGSNRFMVINHFNHLSSNQSIFNENQIKIRENNLNPSILKQNYQIKTQDFNFAKTFQSYEVKYTNSSFIWLIAIDHNKKSIFYSNDNGISFVHYDDIDSIDNIYINEFNNQIVLFSNIEKNQIYLSQNNGKSLLSKNLNFRPDFISFYRDEAILITEKNSDLFKAWLSVDFGKKWILIGENLKYMPQWKKIDQNGYLYWIGEDFVLKKLDVKIVKEKKIANSDSISIEKAQADHFEITENFAYLTVNNGLHKKLLIQKKSSNDWNESVFDFEGNANKIKKFNVVWDSTNQILVAIKYESETGMKTDLFVSNDFEKFQFKLSLKNISVNDKIENLRSKIELKSLNNLGEVYVANAYESGHKKTFTKDPYSDWLPIQFDSEELKDYAIDINNYFYFSHENIQFSFEKPKYPEFMMASATLQGSHSFLCLAHLNAKHWTPVLKGNFLYTYVNHGHLILAFEKGKEITEMLFSDNFGVEWTKFKFSQQPVYADDLIKHPNDHLSSFILFTTDFNTRHKKIFHFDFKHVENSHHHEPNYDDHCPLTCTSKVTLNEICVNQALKCNGFSDCVDEIDEQDCKDTKTKPIDVEIEQDIKNLFDFSLKSYSVEKNTLYLDLRISSKPNDKININKYFIKIADLKSEIDNSSVYNIQPELNKVTQLKISGLNYGSEYMGFLFANITLKGSDSFEFVEKESFKFMVKNENDYWSNSDEMLEKSKFLNKMLIISSLMLLIVFIIFLIAKLKSLLELSCWKKLKKDKVVDQAVIYRKQYNVKNSIVNMKKSKVSARYDLSPFNIDDKEFLIDMPNC